MELEEDIRVRYLGNPHFEIAWRYLLTGYAIGSSLQKNLLKAAEMSSKQRQVADDFTATFPHETIKSWSRMVNEWEADPSKPNPYVSEEKHMFFGHNEVNESHRIS